MLRLSALAVALACASTSVAVAAPAHTITFPPGKACYRFDGVGTEFRGDFGAGQKLQVTATGIADHDDGAHKWQTTESRLIFISSTKPRAPELDRSDEGEVTIPTAGRYLISLGPTAISGNPGTLIVCKR